MSANNFNKASNAILTLRDKKQKQLVLLDHYIRAEENIGRMKFPELGAGEFYFSASQASDYLEVSRERVRIMMKQLEEMKVITVLELSNSKRKPSKYKYNTYELAVEPSIPKGLGGVGLAVGKENKELAVELPVELAVELPVELAVEPSIPKGLNDVGLAVELAVELPVELPVELASKKELLKKNNKKDIYIVQSESLWKLYPNKTGKAHAINKLPKLIEKYGYEQLERCIERYIKGLEIDTWRKPQAGSTFFNSGYVDYLDDNYQEPKAQLKVVQSTSKTKHGRFTQINDHGHNWDMQQLEQLEYEYTLKKARGEV